MVGALGEHDIVAILPLLDRDQYRRRFVPVAGDELWRATSKL